MQNKNLIIDFDNPSDLKKNITLLQKRRKNILRKLGYDGINFNSSKFSMHEIYPLFEQILETDLSSIYNQFDTKKNYYVYVHCNPLKPLSLHNLKDIFLASKFNLKYEPIYIGKGSGNRLDDLNRNDSHRKIRSFLLEKGKDLIAIKLKENLSENNALALESKIIDILGLKCLSKNGYLVNLDEGKLAKERRILYPPHRFLNKLLIENGFNV